MTDYYLHHMPFCLEDFERLGMIEQTGDVKGGEPIYRGTEFGKKFFYAHPTPKEFCEALRRLIRACEDQSAGGKGLKH